MTPEQRRMSALAAVHASWAQTKDRTARTAASRQVFMDRFEQQVDPDGVMSTVDRAKAAESARKAYFQRLALKSSLARAKRKKPKAA